MNLKLKKQIKTWFEEDFQTIVAEEEQIESNFDKFMGKRTISWWE